MIFLDIDGMLPEVMYDLLDDKSTHISRLGGRGIRVERATTIFPAVTLCCQASMFTGTFPATHGIVGNSWFERAVDPPTYRKYTDAKTAAGNYGFALFGWPTIVLPRRPNLQFANNDMNQEIQTIYEMMKRKGLESWNHYNQYSRGADKWIVPTRTAMIIFALCHEELIHNRYWDNATFKQFIKEMRKNGGELPDFTVFYVSGHDNNSHEHGPATQAEYFKQTVDPLFGQLFQELEKTQPLEEYCFFITSDHGQACVTRDKSLIVTMEMLGEMLAGVQGGGFKLFDKKMVREGDTAVVCLEAGTASIHLMNRASGKWTDAPRFQEDLIPAAETFEKFKKGDSRFVDVILVRRERGAEYEVYSDGALIPMEKFFEGKDAEYPDAVRRLKGVNCSRSGDMIVLLDYSTGKYFGDKVKGGEHGNLHMSDSLIPMSVCGPGIPDMTVPTASLVDAVPTIGKILGFDTPTAEGKPIF